MNGAAINICAQEFLWMHILISFRYIPVSRIAGFITGISTFIRNFQTLFSSSFANFTFPAARGRVQVAPHPHQHGIQADFVLFCFLVFLKVIVY